jgi:hypothetical protein
VQSVLAAFGLQMPMLLHMTVALPWLGQGLDALHVCVHTVKPDPVNSLHSSVPMQLLDAVLHESYKSPVHALPADPSMNTLPSPALPSVFAASMTFELPLVHATAKNDATTKSRRIPETLSQSIGQTDEI